MPIGNVGTLLTSEKQTEEFLLRIMINAHPGARSRNKSCWPHKYNHHFLSVNLGGNTPAPNARPPTGTRCPNMLHGSHRSWCFWASLCVE